MNALNNIQLPSPITEIKDSITREAGVRLLLKRDDLIHPVISGNKGRKLEPLIRQAISEGHDTVLSFGGPYSNHLHALAFAANLFSLKSIGIVRSSESEALTPTLDDCVKWGMQLIRPGRTIFDQRKSETQMQDWQNQFGPFYLIPDGGDSPLAEAGCKKILEEISEAFDHVCCPVGTGTTIRGLALSAGTARLHGYLCAKGDAVIRASVPLQVRMVDEFCEGGFAKRSHRLDAFIDWFFETHKIELDYVYNGKMLMGIYEELKRGGIFMRDETVVVVHTGGLQGKRA